MTKPNQQNKKKDKPEKKKRPGRETTYSYSIAKKICDKIASGANLNKLAGNNGFPNRTTIYKWLDDQPEFLNMYVRARELRADWRADRIDAIAKRVENGELDPHQGRVLIDVEKWQAGKEKPRVYGDKVSVEGGDRPIKIDNGQPQEIANAIVEILGTVESQAEEIDDMMLLSDESGKSDAKTVN